MLPLRRGSRVHLLGICGTAMASLAGLLKARGYRVTGSDQNVYPPMSELLARLGIDVRSPYRPENVPLDADLVVVGNALSRGNPELESVLERSLAYASMPEVLKHVFLRGRDPLVVTGTHGKTTTSALCAFILEKAGRKPGFLVGGVPLDLEASFRVGTGPVFVLEGDEYDTAYFDKGPKFLHYLPKVGVIGNVEFDHADIYRDLADVERAFRLFANLVPRNGLLVAGIESDSARSAAAGAPCPVETFAVEGDRRDEADWTAETLLVGGDGTRFRIRHRGRPWCESTAPIWGNAALRNALASAAATAYFGCSPEEVAAGLSNFRGVKRRLQLRGEPRGILVVDDFAHHPTAIRETLAAARTRWPGRKLWGIFEPRSFTARSRTFQTAISESLALADEVVVAAVFRSDRLGADEELSEETLVADLERAGKRASFLPGAEAIAEHVIAQARPGDVIVVMSNGGFGGLHEKLLAGLDA